jgi:hypothetical protein
MRASLDVAGIEVELSVAAGPLEVAIATRYARFLRSVQSPACALRLEPSTGLRAIGPSLPVVERTGQTRFDLAHPAFSGTFDLAGDSVLWTAVELPAADEALGIVFALVAPEHDGILMQAAGVIRARRAGIYLGPAAASMVCDAAEPTLGEGPVLVRSLPGVGWVAAATPFGAARVEIPPPRTAVLDRVWLKRRLGHDVVGTRDVAAEVALSAVIPTADPGVRDSVLALAHQLVAAVPTAELTDRCVDGTGFRNEVRSPAFRSVGVDGPIRFSEPRGVTTP